MVRKSQLNCDLLSSRSIISLKGEDLFKREMFNQDQQSQDPFTISQSVVVGGTGNSDFMASFTRQSSAAYKLNLDSTKQQVPYYIRKSLVI